MSVTSLHLLKASQDRIITIDGVDYPLSFSPAGALSTSDRRPHQVYVMSAGGASLPRSKVGQSKNAAARLRDIHGEWFRCQPYAAIKAVRAAIEFLPLLEEFVDYQICKRPEWRQAVERFRAEPIGEPPSMPIPALSQFEICAE